MPDAPESVLPTSSAGGAPSAPTSVLAAPAAGGAPAAPLSILATPGAGGSPSAPGGVIATPGAESGAVVMVKPESNSGELIPGATANSRPTFSTDGGASAPVSGFWARIYHNGTRWSYIEYSNGSGGSAFSTVAMAGTEATPLEATWQSGYSVSPWVTPPQNVLP